MAIDKKAPRKLNKSSDAKVRKADEMFDALNVSVSEDGKGGNGNGGVLKPIKSNVQLNMLDNDNYEKFVLGKCVDTKYNVVYFFVHSPNNINNDGVYAYDPDGYLPVDHDVNDIVTIYNPQILGLTRRCLSRLISRIPSKGLLMVTWTMKTRLCCSSQTMSTSLNLTFLELLLAMDQ